MTAIRTCSGLIAGFATLAALPAAAQEKQRFKGSPPLPEATIDLGGEAK